MPNFGHRPFFAPSWRFGEEEGWRKTLAELLEREDNVDNLLPVPRLLNVADVTTAAICDAGFSYFLERDGVAVRDVLRANDASDLKLANFEVDARFLTPVNDEVAVRQNLGHHGGQFYLDDFLTVDCACAVAARGTAQLQQVGRIDGLGEDLIKARFEAKERRGSVRLRCCCVIARLRCRSPPCRRYR